MTNEKLTFTVDEMAAALGISRPVVYELSRKEGFPAIRVSERRIIIPVDSLKKWLDRQESNDDGKRKGGECDCKYTLTQKATPQSQKNIFLL